MMPDQKKKCFYIELIYFNSTACYLIKFVSMGNNWGKSQRLPSFLDNGMDEIIERVLWGKKIYI